MFAALASRLPTKAPVRTWNPGPRVRPDIDHCNPAIIRISALSATAPQHPNALQRIFFLSDHHAADESVLLLENIRSAIQLPSNLSNASSSLTLPNPFSPKAGANSPAIAAESEPLKDAAKLAFRYRQGVVTLITSSGHSECAFPHCHSVTSRVYSSPPEIRIVPQCRTPSIPDPRYSTHCFLEARHAVHICYSTSRRKNPLTGICPDCGLEA